MTERDLRRELLALIPRLDIEVRFTNGEFDGGLVRLRGRRVLYLNPEKPERMQVELLCRVLGGEDLSRLYLLPAVRARIESSGSKHLQGRSFRSGT